MKNFSMTSAYYGDYLHAVAQFLLACRNHLFALGDTYGTMWCVDEGLAEGEQVVTAGQQTLRNGMQVKMCIRDRATTSRLRKSGDSRCRSAPSTT